MRILLIQPASPPGAIAGDDWFVFEPLALEYLAAGVAPDNEVKIIDLRLDEDLQTALEIFQPELVGTTSYTVHVNTVKRLCETVKQWNADVVTVVGGHHATVAPEDFAEPAIDLTVVGEGVVPFREIVSRLERHATLEGIPGVAVQSSDSFVPLDDSVAANLDGAVAASVSAAASRGAGDSSRFPGAGGRFRRFRRTIGSACAAA